MVVAFAVPTLATSSMPIEEKPIDNAVDLGMFWHTSIRSYGLSETIPNNLTVRVLRGSSYYTAHLERVSISNIRDEHNKIVGYQVSFAGWAFITA